MLRFREIFVDEFLDYWAGIADAFAAGFWVDENLEEHHIIHGGAEMLEHSLDIFEGLTELRIEAFPDSDLRIIPGFVLLLLM